MQKTFTRAQRRIMRACAKTVAPIMARTFTDKDPTTGKARTVDDPRAMAALERATRRMLTEGGDVQVVEVARETAAALNNGDMACVPPFARHFVAVALDVDGRATYTMRHVFIPYHLDRMAARREVERLMRADLAPHLARHGWEGCA